jgi:hypothetical protein
MVLARSQRDLVVATEMPASLAISRNDNVIAGSRIYQPDRTGRSNWYALENWLVDPVDSPTR